KVSFLARVKAAAASRGSAEEPSRAGAKRRGWMSSRRAHVFASGSVQGVSFRYATYQIARREGVGGWVRNLSDGRVEAIFEGESAAVERLVEWCRHGPPGAEVASLDVDWPDPTGEFSGFTIR
ncbi:MAG TPA: acylphosphatase, partial [Chloroflexota bacterium]|nr:acylphosphatase [Chloroflexota bacterium]